MMEIPEKIVRVAEWLCVWERGVALLSSLTTALILMSCGGSSPPPKVGPPPDFSLSVSPSSVSLEVGTTSSPVTVSIQGENGSSGSVTVTLEGFPKGIETTPASPFTVSAGASQQVTFSAPAAAGSFNVTIRGDNGAHAHTATLGLTVTPQPNPFLIAASYYPWYTPDRFEYVDCYEGTLRGELIPSQLPILGKYDSREEDVITQHIAWSAGAGINVWAMEWIAPNDFLDNTLRQNILANPHIGDIRFAIFYDYAIRFNGDFNLTADKINTILSDFNYLAGNYFSHPSYLKVDQEKPVVFMYATRALNPLASVQSMASSLRSAMSAAGFNIYLIGDEYYGLTAPDPARIGIWDGIFGYDVYLGMSGYSDDNGYLARHQTMYDQYQAVAQQLGVDFIPSLTPGFNDRAVRRVCANNPALARRTSAAAEEGSMFRSFLRDLALPHAQNSRIKMIHITTFNEWHEDTQLEPSVTTVQTSRDTSPTGSQYTQGLLYQGYGTLYLDIIRNAISSARR